MHSIDVFDGSGPRTVWHPGQGFILARIWGKETVNRMGQTWDPCQATNVKIAATLAARFAMAGRTLEDVS